MTYRFQALDVKRTPTGASGLLVSIIIRAIRDLEDDDPEIRASARDYLSSAAYQDHKTWLGIDPSIEIDDSLIGDRDRALIDRWRVRQMSEAEARHVLDRQIRRTAAERAITYTQATRHLAEARPLLFINTKAQLERAREHTA